MRVFSVILVFLFASSASAGVMKKLALCKTESFANLLESVPDHRKLAQFPSGLFLARHLAYLIEENGTIKYAAYKNMMGLNYRSEEVCVNRSSSQRLKKLGIIPVMIDQTEKGLLGHSFWSFSMVFENSIGSLTSHRSLQKQNHDYIQSLISQGFQVEKVQLGHEEYELRMVRERFGILEKIVVTFDRQS